MWSLFRTSGHTERFSDLMVKDLTTGECFRADHVLKDHLEKLAAEPKCTPDKNQEYNAVMTKVRSVRGRHEHTMCQGMGSGCGYKEEGVVMWDYNAGKGWEVRCGYKVEGVVSVHRKGTIFQEDGWKVVDVVVK